MCSPTPTRKKHQPQQARRGVAVVLAIFFLVILLVFVAIAIDFGYLVNARAEMQRTADAAAMAACWDYADQISNDETHANAASVAVLSAGAAAHDNAVCGAAPNLYATDFRWGHLNDFTNRAEPLDTSNPLNFNAIEITLRRTATQNGEIPFFVAPMFGQDGIGSQATATAAIVRDIAGFSTPVDGTNLDILPIAVKETLWNSLLAGNGSDDWTWNKSTKRITPGGDGVVEINIYPRDNASSGNSGTVDIGPSNNSTSHLSYQITDGITAADLAHHGGSLAFNDEGILELNGDTGISAGIKDDLASIRGKPRIVPIFRKVQGPGNNAQYTIVAWGGVRIMEVKLTGAKNQKRVVIQVAPMVTKGVIPSDVSGTSQYVYSPVVLVR